MKIPLLSEIQPFDNTEKVYESISGYTFENGSSEKPGALARSTLYYNLQYTTTTYLKLRFEFSRHYLTD